MPSPPQASPLVVTQVGTVTVVRVGHPLILSGAAAQAVTQHLQQLADAGRTQVVVNCANVQSLTSLIMGKFIDLNKKLSAAGGELVLCDVQPDVREILDVVGLPMVVKVLATEQAALDSFRR